MSGSKAILSDPVLLTLLAGTRDPGSPLRLLHAVRRDLVGRIYALLLEEYASYIDWSARCVQRVGFVRSWAPSEAEAHEEVNVNMMPFVLGDRSSLPEGLRYMHDTMLGYLDQKEKGKVCYLTLQCSWVEYGATQRRPGLHVETPGVLRERGKIVMDEVSWGGGRYVDEIQGGLYVCTDVARSCLVFNCEITKPAVVCGKHGDIQHMKEALKASQPERKGGESSYFYSREALKFHLRPNIVYWMTDRTPHVARPVKAPEGSTETRYFRRFFRLVTSNISAWYADHSTPNPTGVVPPPGVKIIHGNKFDE